RVDEIRALGERTRKERPRLLELSQALTDLDTMLLSSAKGFGLLDLYAKVPAPLRGYVELVYDLNNHPSYRLFEPLLYKSEYYAPSLQSLMLSTISGDDRPFVLSTPRLESDDTFHWQVPFTDEAVDALFTLKSTPQPYGAIREMVGPLNGHE